MEERAAAGRKDLSGGVSSSPRSDALLSKLQGTSVDGIDPDWASSNPDEAQARLQDKEWRLFEERYRPMEEAAIDEFLGGSGAAMSRAADSARRGLAAAEGVNERAMGRRGVAMTGDQRRSAEASRGLNAARTVGTAANTAQRETRDRNLEGLGTMLSIGKGISGSAGDNLGAAADMASARQQQNRAASDARRQQTMSTVATLGGMALMAAI